MLTLKLLANDIFKSYLKTLFYQLRHGNFVKTSIIFSSKRFNTFAYELRLKLLRLTQAKPSLTSSFGAFLYAYLGTA